MHTIPVQSRLIARIEYEPDLKDLIIYFRNGEVRAFQNIPTYIVTGMLSAPSPGNFYFEAIRGKFMRSASPLTGRQKALAA